MSLVFIDASVIYFIPDAVIFCIILQGVEHYNAKNVILQKTLFPPKKLRLVVWKLVNAENKKKQNKYIKNTKPQKIFVFQQEKFRFYAKRNKPQYKTYQFS